jgi:hypothetical protein
MKPRTYALTLILGAAALFLSVVAANLLIDPQGVFGTNLLPRSPNINYHYRNLAAYDAAPDRFDGLLFGSSRADQAIPMADLSRRISGVTFANFSVVRGMLPDFVPALEYVLADKAKRGQRLRAVFLFLDIDTFGDPAATNRYIETLLPQALSGESGVYFWWRNLTALQVRSWQSILRDARGAIEAREAPSASEKLKWTLVRFASALSGLVARGSQAGSDYNRPFGQRAHFAEQLQLLQRIAALCRQSGAELIVAVSPLHRAVESRYLPTDLSQALDQVARVTPLWDFTGADWLSDNTNYWRSDTAHYSSEVGRMMLARIFGDPMPRGWERFGRLRGR